jgi:flagellar biosynthesis/type III secretory pathway chaperone
MSGRDFSAMTANADSARMLWDETAMDVQRLDELLGSEFEVLKLRDLEGFEALQPEKNAVLEKLAELAAWASAQQPVPLAWDALHERLLACREAHFRNIQLMQRQLQAVRGTLQALQGEQASAVDLYDRLGQMSRPRGAWAYRLA